MRTDTKRISAQNMMPGMRWNHTIYGTLEVIETSDDYREGSLKIAILANAHGTFVYEPTRMLEIVED